MKPEDRQRIVVHKLDARGREVLSYPGVLLHHGPQSVTLEARFELEQVVLDKLSVQLGDRMVETFYSDRWYNVFAIYEQESDRLKAWYCNIARPARFQDDHVYQEDLALDLVVYPDRRWIVLDREEFEALALTPEERSQALAALLKLQHLAARRDGHFRLPADA